MLFKIKSIRSLRYIFLFTSLLNALLSAGQKLKFKHISSDEGLSTTLVNCVIQDSKGFMWFGTQDGLNKYDGYGIKVFRRDPGNTKSLFSSDVISLCEMNEELMLVGTKEGLSFMHQYNTTFERIPLLKDNELVSVNRIVKESDTTALIATTKHMFRLYTLSKRAEHITLPFEGDIEVKCITFVNGRVFVGTENKGLWELKGKKLNRLEFKNLYLKDVDINILNRVYDIKSYGHSLYIATHGAGVIKVDAHTFEVERTINFTQQQSNNAAFVNNLVISENILYAATKGGLGIYNTLTEETKLVVKQEGVTQEYDLTDNIINDIWLDKEENLWLATFLGGVNVYFSQIQKFPNVMRYNQEEYKNLYVTQQDNTGDVWLGGEKRLLKIDGRSGLVSDYTDVLENNYALCLFLYDQNTFFVGTYGLGLFKVDKRTKAKTRILDKKLGGTIMCLTRDSYNNLLIGTFGDGLFKYNLLTQKLERYYEGNGFEVNTIFSIYEAADKTLWLGTNGQGAYHIESLKDGKLKFINKYTSNNSANEICSNTIYSINQDGAGNYWMASESGLSRYEINTKKFANFYEKDGLMSIYLYSIVKDSTGKFWMSSNRGITVFDPNFKGKTPSFKNYGLKDGVINREHNQNAYFFSPKGKVLFGGINGYNIFAPREIKDNYHIPQIQFISYKRGGKEVETDTSISYKKELVLSWRENYFQLEVAALDYTEPSKNLYSYKLEGYDEDWSEPLTVRYITYTELPGGNYVLKVKASNSDGIWNEIPLELKITVVPPFWKTKWFYILLALFGAGGIYAFTQYRTKAIKKENKVLEIKVAERTKELEEKNRDITSSIEYAKRIQEAILPARDYIFNKLKSAFILYKPKDIVSGDFYWFAERGTYKIMAVVDCTGHGVPGAFMSMIGHNLLHQIVQEKGIVDPAEILNHLHRGVQEALRQGHNEIQTNDGMDVSIIAINHHEKLVKWAGANRPLIIIDQDQNFTKLDGNKFPIGGAQLEVNRQFTCHTLQMNKAMVVYMFSDGYADQFGGDNGKKFMVKRFHELLKDVHKKDMNSQRQELDRSFEQWRGGHEQVDDVLVVGIAI
ncbi:MAG: two-component regulator propeller domain-containing protein [Sediminibacterium sp.]|nr:two-component regulator propeller domain-containing protein [Sediminibacterium sp.]